MIQLIPRVHSKTIVGLITILILFIPSTNCAPFNDSHSQNEGPTSHPNTTNNQMHIRLAPPKKDSTPLDWTINDLGTTTDSSMEKVQSIEGRNGQKFARRVDTPESGSHIVPSFLKEMERYEIRINPVVTEYNESAYKVELHATLMRKSGSEFSRKLIETVEGANLDSQNDLINGNSIGSKSETFKERDSDRNISDSSARNNELVDDSTSRAVVPLNDESSNGNSLQNASVSVTIPTSTPGSSIPSTVAPTLDYETSVILSSSTVAPSLEASKGPIKNSKNLTDAGPSKSERDEKTVPVIGTTKTPSICDRKAETENSSPKTTVESSSVRPSTISEASKSENLIPSSIEERATPLSTSPVASSTTPIPTPIGANQPSDKLDLTRESNSSVHKVLEYDHPNHEYARPAPETEWVPEGVLIGPSYFIASGDSYVKIETNDRDGRNNQVKPSREVKPTITRQNERPRYAENQRQVYALPNQVPPLVISHNLPPPPSPSAPGQTFHNKETINNEVNTRRYSSQYTASNPSRKVNYGQQHQYQYHGQNSGQRGVQYAPRPQQAPGQPIAIEEIVHTKGLRLNEQNRIDPDVFIKIIRHYFANAWAAREDRFVFERRVPPHGHYNPNQHHRK